MDQDLANLVHPVLHYGLQLRDRLERGENPSLELEQAKLKGMLLSDLEASRWIEFGGETHVALDSSLSGPSPGEGENWGLGEAEPPPGGLGDSQFLGARYALVCWLDDLFILHSPWESAWNERKLEVALYHTNDRAWRFWQQARLAEARPTSDALEVFFLCVMLGFRGEMLETPDRLRAWCKSVQSRLSRLAHDVPQPPELEPPVNVPPLHGGNMFRQALFWTCVLLLFLIPVASFLLVQGFAE